MTDEACTESTGTRFYITNAAHRYIDKSQAVTVKVDTVVQTTGYTVEYAGGWVEFAASKTGQTVTVTGYWWTMETVAQFYKWDLDLSQDALDTTDFSSAGWKSFTPGIKEASASAEAYYINDEWMNAPGNAAATNTASQPCVFYTDASGHYEGYFVIKGIKIGTPADELITGNIDFVADGPVYYRAS